MSDQRSRFRGKAAACFGAALLSSVALLPSYAEDEPADKEAPSETPVQLPPFPNDADLASFTPSATANYTFFIDTKSLSVTPEGIVRYTLVAKSRNGATNISYEGLRCTTMRRKTYALGRDDRTWASARNQAWMPIDTLNANRQHASLALDYFCQDGTVSGNAASIVRKFNR